ncbi:MAG: TlpA disulfide reductase family protein [bacterium]|nr:TlpA disulfide reductase family protein [bacterium]
MQKKIRKLLLITIMIFTVFGLFKAIYLRLNQYGKLNVGDKAIAFTLFSYDGHKVNLSDFYGKKVFLIFISSKCPHCEPELAALQYLNSKYSKDSLVFLAIQTGKMERTDTSPFPILMDKGKVHNKYGVTEYPATFFINEKGKVVYIFKGDISLDKNRTLIGKFLCNDFQ